MAKVTVKELEALAEADVGRRIRDADGVFGVVRSRVGGVSVVFKWRYRVDGAVREIVLGTWPGVSLAQVRQKRAEAAKEQIGTDHALERKLRREAKRTEVLEGITAQKAQQAEVAAKQAADAARLTVQGLYDRWSVAVLTKHKDGGTEAKRIMVRDVLPSLSRVALEDVKRTHVAALVDKLTQAQYKRAHKIAFSLCRQMFRYAVGRGYIENDPTSSIEKRTLGQDNIRTRTLAEPELRALDAKMDDARLKAQTRLAVWLALATGCRVGELLKAQWSHVDKQAGTWTIPDTKNGRTHVVYLSAFAAEQFDKLRKLTGETPWCFPGRVGSHMDEKAITKQLKDRQQPDKAKATKSQKGQRSAHPTALLLPGGAWTPHDLRRTAATLMVHLGTRPDVVERCLNHTEQNRMVATYQHASLVAEQTEAWRLLGERLALLRMTAEGGNVVVGQFGGAAA